jgi:redox-regulated HSP33 family molecular chaperone
MEDSDKAAFLRVLERFDSGAVFEKLAGDAAFADFGNLLDLPGAEVRDKRDLMFRCRCSKEKMLAALKTFDVNELREMQNAEREQQIVCHMCGDSYMVTPDDVRRIIAEISAGDVE